MKETLDIVYIIVLILVAIGGFFGASAFFTRRVNENFDRKYEADRAERDAAKKEAEERDQARIERQMLIEEQLVAVGYVARETADAHLAKCGPNEKISIALETYADCRKRSENQLRKSAAKYEQRGERIAQ